MTRLRKFSLDELAGRLLDRAAGSAGGHAAEGVVGGRERVLRQILIGMVKGSALREHESPGEATVHVLRGRVGLASGETSWEGRAGDLLLVPDARHSLEAFEDSAILLTVVKRS
ncbi:cupin domain-containing protein [Sphaerisporangium viridialbum]|uniref:cupin domain-containing protein n=1 Tax=Sphaerisporangium viridialbum TaxID=46189 RepID=UPI003C71F748